MTRHSVSALAVVAVCAALAGAACATPVPVGDTPGSTTYDVVARFSDAMPTGVTVSHQGRVFVNFPRWGDPVPHTVAEIVNGKEVAYPDAEVNRPDPVDLAGHLHSVQSVVVDPADRLWILDTGSIEFAETHYGGPKLLAVDLDTNKVVQSILFPADVALPHTYLNDVRFDLRRGAAGTAFITDSSTAGQNALIVVDLATGKSLRRLQAHPSVHAESNFQPVLGGRPFMNRPANGPATGFEVGADGIAISADGKRLYYCPLSSRRLYSVSVDALADPTVDDDAVAATVDDHGGKAMSDGLESDDQGGVYGGDLEHNSLWHRAPDGKYRTLAQSSELAWIDTLSIGTDRRLYFTANQLDRQAGFNTGTDLRRKPYLLLRMPIDAGPVLLK